MAPKQPEALGTLLYSSHVGLQHCSHVQSADHRTPVVSVSAADAEIAASPLSSTAIVRAILKMQFKLLYCTDSGIEILSI